MYICMYATRTALRIISKNFRATRRDGFFFTIIFGFDFDCEKDFRIGDGRQFLLRRKCFLGGGDLAIWTRVVSFLQPSVMLLFSWIGIEVTLEGRLNFYVSTLYPARSYSARNEYFLDSIAVKSIQRRMRATASSWSARNVRKCGST